MNQGVRREERKSRQKLTRHLLAKVAKVMKTHIYLLMMLTIYPLLNWNIYKRIMMKNKRDFVKKLFVVTLRIEALFHFDSDFFRNRKYIYIKL